MSRPTLLKFTIPLLLALAIALGLIQRARDPYLSPATRSADSNKSLADYYQESKILSNQQAPATAVTFLAVGDIMLSRNVATAIKQAGDVNLPFSKMADILRSTDFNFGNLESPFYFNRKNPADTASGIIGGHSLVFGSPVDYARSLKDFNFQALDLANNHALDQSQAGLESTRELLASDNIQTFGAGNNLTEAWQPAIVTANGIKICFIGASYASVNDGGKSDNIYVARIEDIQNLKSKILNLKSNCDFVVVAMHAGVEYTRKPNQAQIDFGHAAIDFGADMVIGSHPHWVQTIEKYCPMQSSPPNIEGVDREAGRGGIKSTDILPPPPAAQGTPPFQEERTANCPNPKYIFYSLGNFIFDQMFSQDTREGLALKITITKNEVQPTTVLPLQGTKNSVTLNSIELIPVIIENYSTPRPATGDEAKKILYKIGETSSILKP